MKAMKRILLCILMIAVLFGVSIAGNSVVKSETTTRENQRTSLTKEERKEWDAPDPEVLDYYGLGEFRTTLPVLYLNTKGQQVLKENVIMGNLAVLEANGKDQSIYSVPNSLHRVAIKYRGASSYTQFDKKQYRIKFFKDQKEKAKDVSLVGMGATANGS